MSDEMIKLLELLYAMIDNFSQSIVDDEVKANAEFSYKAGLRAKIIRKTDGHCCKWCSSLAGVHEYPNVDRDIYRRHKNCGCTVTYMNERGQYQDVHSKKNINDFDLINERKINIANLFGKNDDDPLHDVLGNFMKSHPKESEKIFKHLKEIGVVVNFSSDTLAYGPRLNKPGIISITYNASYGALLHEYQHAIDDFENNWDGLKVLWTNPQERINREKRAYQREIDLANQLGYNDVVKKLRNNLQKEIERIILNAK